MRNCSRRSGRARTGTPNSICVFTSRASGGSSNAIPSGRDSSSPSLASAIAFRRRSNRMPPPWLPRARPGSPGEPDRGGTRAWLLWFGVLVLLTVGMLQVQHSLHAAHVALAYLLVVLGASASGGRVLGLTL